MTLQVFSAGENPTAAKLNAVSRQAVQVVTSSTRPGSPDESMEIGETDTDRLLVYDGAAWQRRGWYSSAGRTGTSLRRAANQSITTNTQTQVSFDTEDADTDGFIAVTGTTITIPAGLGGLYGIAGHLYWASSPGTSHVVFLSVAPLGVANSSYTVTGATGSNSSGIPAFSSTWQTGVSFFGPLAATDTVQLWAYQNSGGSINVTAKLTCYRMGL